MELSFHISGPPEETKLLAEAIASSPVEDEDKKVSLTWSPPALVPGMTQTTYELLSAIGVLSFPLSVVASIIANLITSRVASARIKIRKRTARTKSPAPEPRITLSIVDLERGKVVKLEMSQCDEAESVAICKALIEVSHAD
jgi:hypothetical protein